MVELSVIIPSLNEEDNLKLLFDDLKKQQNIEFEILLSDGGSADRTLEIAREEKITIVTGGKGRGSQMNLAASKALADYFLFLHADSRLKDIEFLRKGLDEIKKNISKLKTYQVAGHSGLKFIRTNNENPMAYNYTEEKTIINRPWSINGDQGFLIAKKYFDELDGFNSELHFLEDQKLAKKVRDNDGQWILLPNTIYTSARRFETEGFHRRYILMSIIMGLFATDNKYFFKRASGVYKTQSDIERLQLWPFFKTIWQMFIFDLGFRGSIKTVFQVGKYIRSNSWQMFYFFDHLFRKLFYRGSKKFPLLKFHDKVFEPLTNNLFFDLLVSVLTFFWFMIVLPIVFFFLDRGNK